MCYLRIGWVLYPASATNLNCYLVRCFDPKQNLHTPPWNTDRVSLPLIARVSLSCTNKTVVALILRLYAVSL